MKFAYADPPYLNCGYLYKDHPDSKLWDDPDEHRKLIDSLSQNYPDGWAYSLHTPSLKTILPMCPDDTRIAAWVKPHSCGRPGTRVIYAWEPVLFRGGRKGYDSDFTPHDWLSCPPMRQSVVTHGIIGMKPRAFARWIFQLLGAESGDQFDDLFPGTGAIGAAWAEWTHQTSPLPRLPLEEIAWAGIEE